MDWADKIAKLRAKAADESVGPDEAQVIMDKITELMSDELIREAVEAGIDVKPDEMADVIKTFEMAYGAVMRDMYAGICRAFHCKAIQLSGGKRLHIFGFRSDLAKVEDMFDYLLQFGERELVWSMARRETYTESLKTFKTSFWRAYMYRVTARLRDLVAASTKAAEDSSPGTALVLVTRDGHVNNAVSRVYPRLRTITQTVRYGEGYRMGAASGNRASLGQTGHIAGRRALGR